MADVLPETTDIRWSSPEFVAARYREMLADTDAWMRKTLSLAADPRAYPLVFHCAAGKDRTGIVALIVLALLGVSREDIIADYMLTRGAMDRMMAHVTQTSPERAWQMQLHIPAITATREGNVAELMRMNAEQHGSIEGYCHHIRAGDSIPGIRENLLQLTL